MNKIFTILSIIGASFFILITAPSVNAASFDAGRIIDDGVFTDTSSMNVTQIQQFLNSKVPECDTWGAKTSEFGGGTRAQWAASHGYSAPFTCLRNYSENGISSAQIIYNISQQYGISPKVLIVLLQKEQSLITDDWPTSSQYKTATGYGCPDTAACDTQYYGFTNQVTWSAKMFRAIINNSPTWYTPYTLGNNFINYNPSSSCGGSNVYIQNRATQALYNYTPYQPNPATLAASWGTTVSCGAYGNLNFYRYFTSWFGSTTTTPTYGYSIVSKELYSDPSYTIKISDNLTIEPNTTAYLKLIIKNTGNQVWYKDSLHIGGQNPIERLSIFATDSWLSPGRLPSMSEDSVGGGDNATFFVKIKTPQYLGDFQESFGVLIEGQRWLDGSFTVPIKIASVNPYYSIQNISFDVYSNSAMTNKISNQNLSLYTGSKVYVKSVIKNAGNQLLPANITKIAASNPLDRISAYSNGWTTQNRVISATNDIKPQENGTFTFALTAPASPNAWGQEQFGLLIEGQRWLSDNIGGLYIRTIQRPPSELNSNQTLEVNQLLLSYDEKYKLILQADGNLVLYSPSRALWSSGTVGQGGIRLVMQDDGNLVLYRSNWTPVWNSRTSGRGVSKLIPQTDGNLVIYNSSWRPTWYTSTYGQ